MSKDLQLHIPIDNYTAHKYQYVKKPVETQQARHATLQTTKIIMVRLSERFFGLPTENAFRRGALSTVADFGAATDGVHLPI